MLLAMVACGGGSDQPPTPPQAETATPSVPQATESPTSTPEIFQPLDAERILAMGTDELAEQVMDSPELMTCISERLGFAVLMELAQREPSQEEVDQLAPCFEESVTADLVDAPVVAAKEAAPMLTLLQTGKTQPMPLVLMEIPGDDYWESWNGFVRDQLLARGYISREDLSLYKIAHSAEEATA